MEFIDNPLDDAEALYRQKEKFGYPYPIRIVISIDKARLPHAHSLSAANSDSFIFSDEQDPPHCRQLPRHGHGSASATH